MVKRKNNSKKKIILLVAIIAAGYFIFNNSQNLSAESSIPSTPTVENVDPMWWDEKYTFRSEISVSTSNKAIVEINHAQLVLDGKSNADGSDLKVVARKGDLQKEVSSSVYNADSIATKISFDTNEVKADKFYLYYGNRIPLKQKNVLGTNKLLDKANSTLGKEVSPTISISSFRKWVLEEKNKGGIDLIIDSDLDEASQYFLIINDNKEEKTPVEVKNGGTKIKIDNLKAGEHSLYLISSSQGKVHRSNTLSFYYSSPIYIAWTIDWEGSIPQKRYLDMMEKLSDDYSINMTHYYNPRIYINLRTSEFERRTISEWIVNRLKSGDDIGLHMHMQHDLVEEAGIKAKYSAQSWDSGVSGYDTPSTAYTYDEFLRIVKWGKDKVKEQIKKYSDYDIPELQGYRAGGWFANIDNLRAIEDAGFIYDTSGRVPMAIGNTKMTQPWNLKNTTQPYYPSTLDQNSSGTDQLMELLEIPNNGADSYWSTSKELISNFYANYDPGSMHDIDRIIVYLSHPDWFDIDDPKLRELFDEVNKYSYEKDMGPVKFVTIREYLENSEFLENLKQ